MTKFHEDWTINVTMSVNKFLLSQYTEKCPRPLVAMFFLPTGTILELFQDINGTNLLTKFHEDWTIYVASRVLTSKNAPTPGGHFFKQQEPFKLIQDIIRTNILVLKRKNK
ncbi:hypothetical protein DPMN_086538 [Dreissena polymorpha]|uniref:Uncharacterized protein n=1 Tax=Dreissena polymorpha TaxID=45954 RepID=A0A9D4KR33_DREPO|nr:hypothetical protein DPMN_086538 [Dreissena polymorpha]